MAKNTHLTLSDRIAIEVGLRERKSFSAIAVELGKDPTTISKEVRTHIKLKQAGGYNPCVIRKDCKHYGDLCQPCKFTYGKPCHSCYQTKCFEACPDFQQLQCSKLNKPPYVCNGICMNNADEIMLDERTIYNYVDAGLLSVGNVDLPRKVRYKVRKKKPSVRVDKQCHLGRTYEDFLEYTAANPDTPVVEIDSVEGRKGGKVLLTVFFRNSNLMLAFLRDRNTARSVTEVFEWLYNILGHEQYCRLFPIILTDRGSEFTDPVSIECTKFGEIRSRVFYCDPQRSDQKGGCEVTHEFIRRVLPKGTSFDHLQQSDILRMMSHINSYTRKKLNNQSAHRLFSFLYGETILPSLGIQEIPANDINLTPRLLKK